MHVEYKLNLENICTFKPKLALHDIPKRKSKLFNCLFMFVNKQPGLFRCSIKGKERLQSCGQCIFYWLSPSSAEFWSKLGASFLSTRSIQSPSFFLLYKFNATHPAVGGLSSAQALMRRAERPRGAGWRGRGTALHL